MDRPIIFSAPMVRALLDGRKTQTRRVLKPPYEGFKFFQLERDGLWLWTHGSAYAKRPAPYAAGDRLWVREAHMFVGGGDPGNPIYRANWREDAIARHMQNLPADEPKGWRPSIHMPRWASRLTLAVTGVRVERLQDISHADAVAEGVGIFPHSMSAQKRFRELWNSINGPDAWDANPWVAAISFTVHRANIDALDIGAAA